MQTNIKIVRLAYWLIKLRWYAIVGIIIALNAAKYILNITILQFPVYLVVVFLFLLNVVILALLKRYIRTGIKQSLTLVKMIMNIQIFTDLIALTVLLHFTGGVENPFIIYYIFHMIIGSIVMSPRESFIQTTFALVLIGLLAFLEYSGILPHYPLKGFFTANMFSNVVYLTFTGMIFISTSYFVIYITSKIVRESKKHEEAYLLANLELNQKDKVKDEYVMRITHDIKGHIMAVQSIISVLDEGIAGTLNERQEEFIKRAMKRINMLNSFTSDLLSLTKRRLGEKPQRVYFDLAGSIDNVVKMAENSALEKQMNIFKDIDKSIGDIYGEQSSIEEVITNLLLNAIKYSPAGRSVEISAKSKTGEVQIDVTDHGYGIPEKELKLIFNEFYRASNVKSAIKDGTGLGLSISKHIVESHGGKIWVQSKENVKTTFSFTLRQTP